jgi:hypothetical protein
MAGEGNEVSLNKKWRPEGFNNPYPPKPEDYNYDCEDDVRPETARKMAYNAFELGADALMEALKKDDRATPDSKMKGTWVFIPD